MSRVKRVSTAVSSVAFAILLSSSSASAQGTTTADGYHNAHRLGGSTSFYKPPLTNVASLKRMAGARGMEADIRKVLADSGIPDTSVAVLAVLSGATSAAAGGTCTDARPADGVLVECDFQPGATLEWMRIARTSTGVTGPLDASSGSAGRDGVRSARSCSA